MRAAVAMLVVAAACGSKEQSPGGASGVAASAAGAAKAGDARGADVDAPPLDAAAIQLEESAWPHLAGLELAPVKLAGPFATLQALCDAFVAPRGVTCRTEPLHGTPAPMTAPFLELGLAVTDDPPPDVVDPTDLPTSTLTVGVRTPAGWYALVGVGEQANATTWMVEASRVGDRLVLDYTAARATMGRWAKDYEEGLVVCGADASGAAACTPQIPYAIYDTQPTEEHGDRVPEGKTHVTYRCKAELREGDHLVVTGGKTRDARDCAKLAHVGDHVIPF